MLFHIITYLELAYLLCFCTLFWSILSVFMCLIWFVGNVGLALCVMFNWLRFCEEERIEKGGDFLVHANMKRSK